MSDGELIMLLMQGTGRIYRSVHKLVIIHWVIMQPRHANFVTCLKPGETLE